MEPEDQSTSATSASAVSWVTENVAITNYLSARNPDLIHRHDIRAVLCLDREAHGTRDDYSGIAEVELVHLNDGDNEMRVFARAVRALQRMVGKHKRVLVHCLAGRSRSVSVVAGYLRITRGLQPEEALAEIRRVRSVAVAPALVRLLDMLEV